MATPFHTTVSLEGYHFEDSIFTVNLAAGITAADIGKPMSIDTGAANKFKIAADGKRIVGKLASVENRSGVLIGAVEFRHTSKWPVKASDALAIGDMVVGAGSGEVRKWATNDDLDHSSMVVNVTGGYATVIKI